MIEQLDYVMHKCANIHAINNPKLLNSHKTPYASQLTTSSQHNKLSMAPPPHSTSFITHKVNADTGTTGHYFALKDVSCLHNVQPVHAQDAITVTLPAGEEIQSTHIGELHYSPNHEPQQVHVFESLWGSLLGIGDLCDAGLVAVFDKNQVFLVDPIQKTVILTGTRNKTTR